jgi:hypothetical protein
MVPLFLLTIQFATHRFFDLPVSGIGKYFRYELGSMTIPKRFLFSAPVGIAVEGTDVLLAGAGTPILLVPGIISRVLLWLFA